MTLDDMLARADYSTDVCARCGCPSGPGAAHSAIVAALWRISYEICVRLDCLAKDKPTSNP